VRILISSEKQRSPVPSFQSPVKAKRKKRTKSKDITGDLVTL